MNESRDLQKIIDHAPNQSCVRLTGTYEANEPVILQNKTLHFETCGKVIIEQKFSPSTQKPIWLWENAGGSCLEGTVLFNGLDDESVYDFYYPLTGASNNLNNFSALEIHNSECSHVERIEVRNKIAGVTIDDSDHVKLSCLKGWGFTDRIRKSKNWHCLAIVSNSENYRIEDVDSFDFSTNTLTRRYSQKYAKAYISKSGKITNLWGKNVRDHGVYNSGGDNIVIDSFYFEGCPSSCIRVDGKGLKISNGTFYDSNVGINIRNDRTTVSDIYGNGIRDVVRMSPKIQNGEIIKGGSLRGIYSQEGALSSVRGIASHLNISEVTSEKGTATALFLDGSSDIISSGIVSIDCFAPALRALRCKNCHFSKLNSSRSFLNIGGASRYAQIFNTENSTFEGFYSDTGNVYEDSSSSKNLFYDVNSLSNDQLQGNSPRTI